MKMIRKLAAGLIAAVMAVGVTACSTDTSWAIKTSTTTIPIGAYIYNLYNAASTGSAMREDTSKHLLDQQLEGVDAATWIKDRALMKTKQILAIDAKLAEMGVTLTDEDLTTITEATDAQWGSVKAMFDEYNIGVSKSSFQLAYAEATVKANRLFEAVYGKGGTAEVSDDELKAYFEENYTDFAYVLAPLYNENYEDLSDDDKAALKKEFDGYLADVESDAKTIEQAAAAYKESSKAETDPLVASTENLANNPYYPEAFTSALKEMKPGEARLLEVSSSYVLLQKNDITAKSAGYVADEKKRSNLLTELKSEEFTDMATELANNYTADGFEINQPALNKYNPATFLSKETVTSSSPASSEGSASSEATSSGPASSSAA